MKNQWKSLTKIFVISISFARKLYARNCDYLIIFREYLRNSYQILSEISLAQHPSQHPWHPCKEKNKNRKSEWIYLKLQDYITMKKLSFIIDTLFIQYVFYVHTNISFRFKYILKLSNHNKITLLIMRMYTWVYPCLPQFFTVKSVSVA
jgi:hypothetical protein